MKCALLWTLVVASPLLAQEEGKNRKEPVRAHPKVDQKKVDEAIRKGLAYLKGSERTLADREVELVLWTLVKSGVPETDPLLQKLLRQILAWEIGGTYNVSLHAMILEELDRVKYQDRIWQCAQYLVDNMGPNGQWGYGEPTTYGQPVPTTSSRKNVATPGSAPPKSTGALPKGKPRGAIDFEARPDLRRKPPVVRWLQVKKQRAGRPSDNSNSQYAALGLRACHDAGIEFPKEIVERARKWWVQQARPEGGAEKDGVATGQQAVKVVSWGYHDGNSSNGSMTAGAVGSLVIYDYMLGQPYHVAGDNSEGRMVAYRYRRARAKAKE